MSNGEQNPEAVMHQVKAELANAYAQEFFTTVRDKCFAKCVTKPSGSMSSGESACLEKCVDRYVEATKMISHVVLQAYQRGGQ
ncbi:Tim10/DDP family zinc finger [Ostreococcus tauri]|uniref:Mitochondrial import inner membrane translocase subunit n=1 Tax=Ostreococcus tauri TaxID=70448 RepID=A0A090LYI2_OSTTA|nr:Tim10/DDP family zinc finger [Ostreococcus tauri]OUS42439.1 MPT family transporter: inner membrane translocase Tim13 [Ostreococcus tauri]CEF96856.1 Tim10/DDP family zinc finger [Ostreococcus tauri]|eukprot:XP_022838339.1 Tim10/DDP family zinc finger [Ostreococcus tauri]